jgi:AcrR family transcriptional regulator
VSPCLQERARVHDTLIELCFERGFANVTVEALCQRAAIRPAVFREEYTDTEDCLCQVYEVERARIMGRLAEACAGVGSWRQRVRISAYVTLRLLTEDEKLTNFVVNEVRIAGDRSRIMIGEALATLFDLLDEGRLQRSGPGMISRDTAVAVGGGIFNQIYSAVGRGEPVSANVVPQMLYTAMLPYLGREMALEELSTPSPLEDRASIREALLDLGWECGFSSLTLEMLSERAGVALGDFKREYLDLDDCLSQVYAAEVQRLRNLNTLARAGRRGWRQRLRASLYALYGFLTSDRRVARLLAIGPRTTAEASLHRFEEAVEELIDQIDEGRQELPNPDSIGRDTAESLAAEILGQIYAAIGREPSPAAGEAIVPTLMYWAVVPYLGEAAALEELRVDCCFPI